jgi:hypothetical protein
MRIAAHGGIGVKFNFVERFHRFADKPGISAAHL